MHEEENFAFRAANFIAFRAVGPKIFSRAFRAFLGFCARSQGQSQGDLSGTPPIGGTYKRGFW